MLALAPTNRNLTMATSFEPERWVLYSGDSINDQSMHFISVEAGAAKDERYRTVPVKNTTVVDAVQFAAGGLGAFLGGVYLSAISIPPADDLLSVVSGDFVNLQKVARKVRPDAVVAKKYADLYAAVSYMASLDESHELFIDSDTSRAASYVLGLLGTRNIAAPRIFSSGEDAAVLSWDLHDATLFLTISEGTASLMINSKKQGATRFGHAGLSDGANMENLLLRLSRIIG